MNYPHIFGYSIETWNRIAVGTIVTFSSAIVTNIFLKAEPSHRISLVRSASIPVENVGSDSQASRESVDSHRSGRGQFLPGRVAAISSAAPDHMHSNPRTQPIFAARRPRLHIEESGR